MAYLADFCCTECGKITEDIFFKSFEDFDNNKNRQRCELCDHKLENVWINSPSMNVAENNDPTSTKPSSYWRNAEKIKQEEIKKRGNQQKEKEFYNDKQTIQKQKARQRNLSNANGSG